MEEEEKRKSIGREEGDEEEEEEIIGRVESVLCNDGQTYQNMSNGHVSFVPL